MKKEITEQDRAWMQQAIDLSIENVAQGGMMRPKSVEFSACMVAMPKEMVRLLLLVSMLSCMK